MPYLDDPYQSRQPYKRPRPGPPVFRVPATRFPGKWPHRSVPPIGLLPVPPGAFLPRLPNSTTLPIPPGPFPPRVPPGFGFEPPRFPGEDFRRRLFS